MSNILELNIALYSHRHEADQDYNHLGQLEEVELLLLDTALPLLLSPEVIKLNKVNNTIEKKNIILWFSPDMHMPYVLPLYDCLTEAVENLLLVEPFPLSGAETRP